MNHVRRQYLKAGLCVGASALSQVAAARSLWRNAFATSTIEYESEHRSVKLPAELAGSLYRIGPGLMHFNQTWYQHWFDGDGVLHRFSFANQTMRHYGRLLQTPKMMRELAAGKRLYSGFGTTLPHSEKIQSLDDLNVANINTLSLNHQLYALWEAGSALEVSADTLQSKGFKAWSAETKGLPFGAHPHPDRDGSWWNIGYQPTSGKVVLYHIDASGTLKRQGVVALPNSDMVHDFAITERYLILLLMPLKYDAEKICQPTCTSVERLSWQPAQAGYIALIDKNTLATERLIETPPWGVFHFGNAHEVGSQIKVHFVEQTDFTSKLNRMGQLFQANPSSLLAPNNLNQGTGGQWHELTIDLAKKTTRSERSLKHVEFPRFDVRLQTQIHRFTILLQKRQPEADFSFDSLVSWDHRYQRPQLFHYGKHYLVEEHVFVPNPNSSEYVR